MIPLNGRAEDEYRSVSSRIASFVRSFVRSPEAEDVIVLRWSCRGLLRWWSVRSVRSSSAGCRSVYTTFRSSVHGQQPIARRFRSDRRAAPTRRVSGRDFSRARKRPDRLPIDCGSLNREATTRPCSQRLLTRSRIEHQGATKERKESDTASRMRVHRQMTVGIAS